MVLPICLLPVGQLWQSSHRRRMRDSHLLPTSSAGFLLQQYTVLGASQVIARGKEPACPCRRHRRHGFSPGSGRSPEGGHGSPLQYSLPGESHGQRSLVGYSP